MPKEQSSLPPPACVCRQRRAEDSYRDCHPWASCLLGALFRAQPWGPADSCSAGIPCDPLLAPRTPARFARSDHGDQLAFMEPDLGEVESTATLGSLSLGVCSGGNYILSHPKGEPCRGVLQASD